jgi:hypothetical protein
VCGDVEDGVVCGLTDGLQPFGWDTPRQECPVALLREEARFPDGLLHIALDHHLLDGLADLDDLGGARGRVALELPPLGPGVGVVMVADVGEKRGAVLLVEDDADVAVHARRPEVRVAGVIDPVEREAGAVGALLDVEGGDLRLRLFLAVRRSRDFVKLDAMRTVIAVWFS